MEQNQQRLIQENANHLTNLRRAGFPPITLCHSCGRIIRDTIPPNRRARRCTEEQIPDRYTCVVICTAGLDGTYLTYCHNCNRHWEAVNRRQNAENIVDERGDHEFLLACLKFFPLNNCIGDGLENCAPYVVNIRHVGR